MNSDPPGYITFLLRLWRNADTEAPGWRASLENPRTGERHAFRDKASLLAFLEARTPNPLGDEPDAHRLSLTRGPKAPPDVGGD